MSNIPSLSGEKRKYKVNRAKYMFKLLVRPGQKNTARTKDILQMFSRPENMGVDAYDGTLPVTRPCNLLSKLGRFVRCEAYSRCVANAMLQLILFYIRILLSTE